MNLEGSSHTYVINVSKGVCEFSFDGCLLATSFQNKLTVRNTRSLEVTNIFTFSDLIEYVEWSPDSKYILCASYRCSAIQIFSLDQEEWKCRLQDAESGIVDICWSPDSRHVLTVAEFHVSICIWSLTSHSVTYIECTKGSAKPYFKFSPDAHYLAVVGGRGRMDCVSLYLTITWQLTKNISCVGFGRVGGILWLPDCTAICVWDSAALGGLVHVYRANTGDLIGSYEAPKERITGIKAVASAPSGQFLTLGCLDNKVRLLSHISWQCIMELSHPDFLPDRDCIVYQESVKHTKDNYNVKFKVIVERPVFISSLRFKPEATDIVGIGLLAYSSCGCLLSVRVDCMPAAVWIWSIPDFRLISLVVHNHPVSGFSWSPLEPILAIASATSFVTLWSQQKAFAHVVEELCVSNVKWHSSGKKLVLCSLTKVGFMSVPIT